jgi:hypothetical protein
MNKHDVEPLGLFADTNIVLHRKGVVAAASEADFREAVMSVQAKVANWMTFSRQSTNKLLRAASTLPHAHRHRLGRLAMMHAPESGTIAAAHDLFSEVVFAQHWLPMDEVFEIESRPDASDYILGGMVNLGTRTLTAVRGDWTSVTVPLSIFKPSGDGTQPAFGRFKVIDCGLAVRFGRYESTAEAILYEADPEYRRRLKKNRLAADQSFGASLRRLRLQRRLTREAFQPVAPRTIARIERGEVGRPHGRTLEIIADRLNVQPDDIESY